MNKDIDSIKGLKDAVYRMLTKIDSKDEYAFLVNETKFEKELNSSLSVIDFLNSKYIEPHIKRNIHNQSGISIEDYYKSSVLTTYIAPNYNLKNVTENNSLFGALTTHYLVDFHDGEKGEVFLKQKSNQAYFKEKRRGLWITFHHYYENLDFCIIGLHYYLKTGKVLKEGFINTYS